MSDIKTCCICGTFSKELRNYGPNGAPICFDCMMCTPDRQREAERRFDTLLDAAEAQGLPLVTMATGPEEA